MTYEIIIYIFLVLILAYLATNYKIMQPVDVLLIALALIVLVYTFLKNKDTMHTLEKFAELPTTKIEIDEDITNLNPTAVFYTTAFSSKSYNSEMGKVWKSLVNLSGPKSLELTSEVVNFNPTKGFYLADTSLKGPNASDMDINFQGQYTILLACKHGNLITGSTSNGDVELFKFTANSPNNNGLSFYIKSGTLKGENNTQVGRLELMFSNLQPQVCLVNKNTDELINFDKDVLTFYYIIKDADEVRVIMLTENSASVTQICRFTVTNDPNINFSNSAVLINANKNWNASVTNFGVFSTALDDQEVTQTYNHIKNEYFKRVDPNFTSILSQYNSSVDVLDGITKCPFNNNVCQSCQSVNKWYDTNDVISATDTCKTAVNDYCKVNKTNQWCKCWDNTSTNSRYNTPGCQLYRAIFSGKQSILDYLSDEELKAMQSKYGLTTEQACKDANKPQVKREWAQNRYIEVPASKMRVKTHGTDEEDTDASSAKATPDKVINYYGAADPSLRPSKNLEKEFSVGKMMQQDPNANFDPSQTAAFREYQKIKDILEQQKASSSFVSAPTQNESFFDKFLRVIVPS